MADENLRPQVLLADDEPLIRELIEDALEEAGFDVIVAVSGASALQLLDEHADQLIALVTDISLGDPPSGWEVATRAREISPSIAIVYMTGDSAHEWSARGVPQSSVVTKPFAPSQVVVALASLLNKSDVTP